MSHSDKERVRKSLSQERTQRITRLSNFIVNSEKHGLISPGLAGDNVILRLALPLEGVEARTPDSLDLHMPIIVSAAGVASRNQAVPVKFQPNTRSELNTQRVHDNGNWTLLVPDEGAAILEYDAKAGFEDAASSAMQYLAAAQKSMEQIKGRTRKIEN